MSSMVDPFTVHTDARGVTQPGLYTANLTSLFGEGAFDGEEQEGAKPLEGWLGLAILPAAAFISGWTALRVRAGDSAVVLLREPEHAVRLRQKELIAEVEKASVAELTAQFEALGRNARRRVLWSQLDSFSSAWATM